MKAKDFDKIVAGRMDWCRQTLCAKGDEYAREGDRLWNFKVAARKLNCHPAQALAGMMVKHTVSVDDIIDGLSRGIVPPKELVAEKIGDSINYLLLLEGLVEEARREVPEVDDTLYEGASTESWQTAVSEQDTKRREQVATGSPIIDKIAEACGLKKADVKADFEGVSFVLDAEPIEPGRIYCAPDRTSRATLPDECLGALFGRVRG